MFQSKKYNQSQYQDESNLNKRITIYQYSVNQENWYHWIFKQIPFLPDSKVLELACGNGNLWKQNAEKIFPDLALTLTDINEGMLRDCKSNLKDLNASITYKIVDIENIPFEDSIFDIIIANHVLYHLPDMDKGLSEIKRVLKQKGTFITTTTGKNHLKTLKKIFLGFDKRISFYPEKVAEEFGLENGENKLKHYFSSVKKLVFHDHLEVRDPGSVINYAKGVTGTDTIIPDWAPFETYVENLFARNNGVIVIEKAVGMFIATTTI